MDSSTSGKPKGGTPNRPLASRLSLSKSTKTGSPTQSSKAATESPQASTSRGAGPISKVGTAVKEANAVKSSSIRTVAASPIKSKTVLHKDPASPLKLPAKQTTRPQSGEKGVQQTASLLVTKNETAKKTAEGALLIKPKAGQEAGSAIPSKRTGAVKREVGKLPEYGSVPKDKKTLCLRPESSASVPSKPLATASSPTKTLKASSMSPKSKQIVPLPEKPATAISLSTKATKSPLASTRQGAMTSTTAKPVKTASPLVKASKPTLVSTKVGKTPTSPVKQVNTTSAPITSGSATPVKPPGNTKSTTNQVKVGKRLSITNKATSVSNKQVNNVPTAIRSVKSSTMVCKSVKKDCTEATAVANEINQNLPEVANVEINKTEKIAELEKPQESMITEEVVTLSVNNVIENATEDDSMNGGKLLSNSKLPLEKNKSILLTAENSAEKRSQDYETQVLLSLTPEVKSPTQHGIPTKEEVSNLMKEEPIVESSTELANPLYDEQKSKKPFEEPLNVQSEHKQETLRAPETYFIMEETKLFTEQRSGSIEHLQEELGSHRELAISSDHSVNNLREGVHKTVSDEFSSSIQTSKETVQPIMEENRSLDNDQMAYMEKGTYLNQLERMPIKPLNEEAFTVECLEPLEDAVTSSLEQVTPLEEGVLSEDEPELMEQKDTMLKVEQPSSPETLAKLKTSGEPHNPLEVITSSSEELTPSEEAAVPLKDEKQIVQETSPSENLDMEVVTYKIDVTKTAEIDTFSEETVIYSHKEISTLEETFGETTINTEGKHTEKVNIQSSDLLQSSTEEVRFSEELISEEPQHSSFNDGITPWEDFTSIEPLQTSVEEVKLSEKEPLLSVESVEYSVETLKFPHEDQILSVEPLQDLFEDMKSSQEKEMSAVEPLHTSADEVTLSEDCLIMEPLQSSVETDSSLGTENTSSLLLLKSSLEPLNPVEENLLSSFNKLTEPKESISSLEASSKLERSESPVQLQDLSHHLMSLQNTKEVLHELTEDEDNASSEKEGEKIWLPPQGHPIEQFNSLIEPTQYDAEIFHGSIVKSSEHVEKDIKSVDKDPVGSELFEEPLNMMHDPDYGSPEHVNAEEKLDFAEAGVDYTCNPVKPCQSLQESVLFPEEPLTSIDEFKTTSVEAAAYSEKPIKSSLEDVNCVDNDEKATKTSIHELMGYTGDPTTCFKKSLDTAMFIPSEDIGVCSSEPVDITTNATTLPNYEDHLEKLEYTIPLTSEDNAMVEISVEPQVNKPSIHFHSLESVETPRKHEVLIQPEEPEDQTNMLAPTTEEANYSLQVNQPKALESLTLENKHKTAILEMVTDLEKTSDSDFCMTLDSIEKVKNLSPKQGMEQALEENKRQTTGIYVLNEPISFTNEESLEPSDNTTNIVNESRGNISATKVIEAAYSAESTSISHTSSSATNTISMLPIEQNVEVSEKSDLSTQLLQKVNTCDHPQETEREPWVLVKMEELLDFKEEPEDRLLRPASLNQDAEVQDEQKAEEDLVERASVCSTLSDPQLAAKSSSETSTPEELRTYEDSSSGVESHSDDAATSPQTTLTPDPDLGIHMGQEEGTDTPAGTPASNNNKGIPLPLQIVDIEGQSQSTSPSGISDSSDMNPIVRKKESTPSTELREHDYEQKAKEKGAQRGNDD